MIIDLKEKGMENLKRGDLFIYNGKQVEPISFDDLVKPYSEKLNALEKELSTLKQGISNHDKEFKRLHIKFDRFINIFKLKRGEK